MGVSVINDFLLLKDNDCNHYKQIFVTKIDLLKV